jgi:hypothetical protein
MENQKFRAIAALSFMSVMIVFATTMYLTSQPVKATGCPVDTIVPFIDDAMKSLEAGDIEKAQSQLQDAKNELSDSFEVEEK